MSVLSILVSEVTRLSPRRPPKDCRCDGSGWIVVLDRRRYAPPANEDMVQRSRCSCAAPGTGIRLAGS